jgi:hypothetical protein
MRLSGLVIALWTAFLVTWIGHVARSGEQRAMPLFAGMLLSQWEDSAGRFLYSIDKTLYPETYPLCATDHPACSSSGAAASASPWLVSRANATHTLYEVFAETGEFELCAWATRDEALTPAEFGARVNRTAAVVCVDQRYRLEPPEAQGLGGVAGYGEA